MRARSVAITQAAERSLVQYSSDPQYLRYLTIVFTLTHNISVIEPLMTHRESLNKAVKTEGDRFSQDEPERHLFTVHVAVGVKAA